jgi:hypothetical protein
VHTAQVAPQRLDNYFPSADEFVHHKGHLPLTSLDHDNGEKACRAVRKLWQTQPLTQPHHREDLPIDPDGEHTADAQSPRLEAHNL